MFYWDLLHVIEALLIIQPMMKQNTQGNFIKAAHTYYMFPSYLHLITATLKKHFVWSVFKYFCIFSNSVFSNTWLMQIFSFATRTFLIQNISSNIDKVEISYFAQSPAFFVLLVTTLSTKPSVALMLYLIKTLFQSDGMSSTVELTNTWEINKRPYCPLNGLFFRESILMASHSIRDVVCIYFQLMINLLAFNMRTSIQLPSNSLNFNLLWKSLDCFGILSSVSVSVCTSTRWN